MCYGAGHDGAMGAGLVSAGQDVDRVEVEHRWQDRMGDDGVRGVPDGAVHHVRAAQRTRH